MRGIPTLSAPPPTLLGRNIRHWRVAKVIKVKFVSPSNAEKSERPGRVRNDWHKQVTVPWLMYVCMFPSVDKGYQMNKQTAMANLHCILHKQYIHHLD